jgi:hypothetical protein
MGDSGEAFDASVGLAFSLKVFETYRKSGVFSAEIRALPGFRGKSTAYVELTLGKVVACSIVDRSGERKPLKLQALLQWDEERGPFGWVFHPASQQAPAPTMAEPPSRASGPSKTIPLSPIPQLLVRSLDPAQLQPWTIQQQQCIYTVFIHIDGKHSVDEIKQQIPLPPAVIDEVIRILLLLRIIALQ